MFDKDDTGMKNIEVFFLATSLPARLFGEFHSALYLLRREISSCLCIDPNTGKKLKTACSQELFAATMLILTGVDLLGKFLHGTDKDHVKDRFKHFITKYFSSVSQEDAIAIYQLRNALFHGFGLYSKDIKADKIYNFILQQKGTGLLHQLNKKDFKIDILTLHHQFENGIEKYYSDLKNNSNLRILFNRVFPEYGGINIWRESSK
ncbi:MAG TPA: hypothetical protein VMX17_16265 [Candidatus Glassbacteria bacterium]|nr:hypothetical protein [Candidatus Glassbacteria bacterium]